MALDSLGFGIGLQAQPKDYAGIAERSMANKASRRKAEEAARAKNEEEFNKLITSKDFIQQAGNFHKIYRGQASKEISDFMNRAIQLKNQDPNNYLPQVVQDFQQTQLKLNSYKDNSEKVRAYEKAAFDPKSNSTTWFDPSFIQASNKENFESSADWYKVKSIPGLGVMFNPETGDFNANPPMKVTDDDVIKDIGDTKYYEDVSAETSKTPGVVKGFATITTKQRIRPEVVENRARMWSNNVDYVTSKAIETGMDMSDPNWFSTAKDYTYNYVKGLATTEKQKLSTQNIPGYGGGGSAASKKPIFSTIVAVDENAPGQIISPSSWLKSSGPGAKGKSWNEINAQISDAEKAGIDASDLIKTRNNNFKSRAYSLSNAYTQSGGRVPKEILDVIGKPTYTENDISTIENFFKDKQIKSEDVTNAVLSSRGQAYGPVSEQDRAVISNLVSSNSSIIKGKKIVQKAIIEDSSDLKNKDQDWTVVDKGVSKVITGRLVSIDQMEDGGKVFNVKTPSGTIKTYPYNDSVKKQIAAKMKVGIEEINF